MPKMKVPPGYENADVSSFDVMGPTDIPAGLVSIYRNAAARKIGTQEFLESLKQLAKAHQIPDLETAGRWLAAKYPRIAAHIRMSPHVLQNGNAGASTFVHNIGVKTPAEIMVSPLGMEAYRESLDRVTHMVGHEATHVAQGLGTGNRFNDLYRNAEKLVGYEKNPFEVAARSGGAKLAEAQRARSATQTAVSQQDLPRKVYPNVTRMLEQMAVQAGDDPAAKYIRTLLEQRLGRLPMAVSHVKKVP